MAFSSERTGQTVKGNKRVTWGTYTALGASSGNVATSLSSCESFVITSNSPAAVATPCTTPLCISETFPLAGGSVTMYCEDNDYGYWKASGN